MSRAKVLLVGPVNGRLRLLSEKLRTLQRSKAGPFDICLCSGPFFHRTTVAAPSTDADTQQKELDELNEEATRDGKDLANGLLEFDVPVLFVDVGDGMPEAMKDKLSTALNALKKDGDEIDLDDDVTDEEDGAENDKRKDEDGSMKATKSSPKGLFRVACNLYQLVGDDARRQSHILDGVADIVSVPLPLVDPQSKANSADRHPTSLTIGFLGSKIRLPCKSFEEKSKHTSFLGCDVLLSGEWGQGMSSSKCGALTAEDRSAIMAPPGIEAAAGERTLEMMGSYDVAELVAASRPRYHVAPGPIIPVQVGEAARLRHRFVASLPYRYPATSSTSGEGGHAGRFLAMGSVVSSSEAKALGKAFKFIHAVGIVPLSYMDASDRESARELNLVVDCPYTDASYSTDNRNESMGMNYINSGIVAPGGLSEARARRLAQEDAASALGGGGAYRWQQRPTRKRPRDGDDGPGDDDEELKRQAMEAENPENCSLFLHGLHRDPGMTLTSDALMDAFRPFGCVGVRFPKPKMNHQMQRHDHASNKPSFAFLDFNTHEEALHCLADLKGEAVVRNIMLTLKWSSSPNKRPMQHQQPRPFNVGIPPPPPSNRRNRLTEAEAADSTTLFLRLPPTLDSSAYPNEMETMRLLAQGTMEDELNVGVSLDSPDRITAKDEPALRVTIRHPNVEMNYGFLEFCSHAAALTALVALTGHEDGGLVGEEKLAVSCLISDDMMKKDISHLLGVTLYWARGGQQSKSSDGNGNSYGLKFKKQHFPADSRTDCWFCLASPTCEKHLIVAVFDDLYVAMPKGGVNEHHTLIVPVEHGGDGAMVNRKLAPEMESVKAKLRLHARTALKKDLFVFERSIQTKGGYHPHVQCIPVDLDSGSTIQKVMVDMASKAGFRLKEITGDLGLNALEDDWSNGYFYAEIPLPGGGDEFRRFIYRAGDGNDDINNSDNCHRGQGTVPLQFGREVLAEVMCNPDISQWKACVVSQEKETEFTAEFRKSLNALCP
ncbi:hypothetical protein ACHAW5_009296 [Stephanodiscus triporus]|uniref:RRM domain-containing protein n=1 Tax=Stephanodiscus triporus TaxID=2934178 RepID=A0ABD3NPW4_9STRA